MFITPRVNSETFMGVLWGGTSISLCFLIFRLFVRIQSFRKLYADDFLVSAAWVMLLASTILWQTQQSAMYTEYRLADGEVAPTPEVMAGQKIILHSQVAVAILFESCLWSVKLSFLLFFRRLGQRVRGHRVWWWCVLGFNVVVYVTCMATVPYNCLASSVEFIFTHCSDASEIKFQWAVLEYHCVIDIITDLMIISIPVFMFYKVRVSFRQKLALIAICSLSVIIILFAIIRITVVKTHATQADVTWVWMWANIEMIIAIIVANLASFRQLFVKSAQSAFNYPQKYSSSWLRRFLSSFQESESNADSNQNRLGPNQRIPDRPSQDSESACVVPLDKIRVHHNVSFESTSIEEGMQMPQAEVGNTHYPFRPQAGSKRMWYGQTLEEH